jgi:hypothetical protein
MVATVALRGYTKFCKNAMSASFTGGVMTYWMTMV